MHQPDFLITQRKDCATQKRSLPHWIIWLFIALALLRGLVYAAIFPPWQSPDEHGHFEYAWLISQYGPFVGPESISPEFQQRVLESMYAFDYWRLAHQPMPQVLPAGFTDPSDRWLVNSRPQVGDERPLYYLLTGGLLRLANNQNVVADMYIGRIVSVLLYSATVGITALATRSLFPQSVFMQVVSPAFLLFLPMLGEMGASVSSDAAGILASTLFFASLIPILRDGLMWQKVCTAIAALVLALLSKKTTLFLIPTALWAFPTYIWIKGKRFSQRVVKGLVGSFAFLIVIAILLALTPGGDAAGWAERTGSCGATRITTDAVQGRSTLRTGACTNAVVAQILPPERVKQIAGQRIYLTGWVRSKDQAVARALIKDNEKTSQVELTAEEDWQSFTLTHTVSTNARQVTVRLMWGGTGGAILFDDLMLSTSKGNNLLVNGSAEKGESLLVDLLSDAACRAGASRHLVQQVLSPQSWNSTAWLKYAQAALFCFHSFWGLFGSQALPLPQRWYWVIELTCALALIGSLIFIKKLEQKWLKGFMFTLMLALILLALQTFLPLVATRGTDWLPQGRYLFPGVFAIAILMACGIRQLLPRCARFKRESCATAITAGLFAGFDLACLGHLIVPYFYQ